ncbi:MAG: hypothetical protein WCO08_01605 [Actinomycetes bacterium]
MNRSKVIKATAIGIGWVILFAAPSAIGAVRKAHGHPISHLSQTLNAPTENLPALAGSNVHVDTKSLQTAPSVNNSSSNQSQEAQTVPVSATPVTSSPMPDVTPLTTVPSITGVSSTANDDQSTDDSTDDQSEDGEDD